MTVDLHGKRVLVTAGASGIGNHTLRSFLAADARVHTCDVSADALDACRQEFPNLGVSLCDVADDAAVGRMFDAARATLGDGLDVLVNNAGIGGPTAALEDIDPAEWRRTIDVDLNAMFYCCRRAIPLMKAAGGGCIVNMSSSAGRLGMPLRTPYSAAKFGVVGLTKALAVELGPHRIRVNAILPGNVEGERTRRIIERSATARGTSVEQMTARWVSRSALAKFVDPQEIADMILYLCSASGRSITGQSICIDGDDQTLMVRIDDETRIAPE